MNKDYLNLVDFWNKSFKLDENAKKEVIDMLKEGHAVGIHTWTHEYSTIYSSILLP